MASELNEGAAVRIVDREAKPEDLKSGLFYNHFRGLRGHVMKTYQTGEVAVEVDIQSLPEEVSSRHLEMEEGMKNRWLEGLSDEARNRLTEPERRFRLRYTIMVAAGDLEPDRSAAEAPHAKSADAETPAPRGGREGEQRGAAASAQRSSKDVRAAGPQTSSPAAPRATSKTLDENEASYLEARRAARSS